MKKVVCAVFSLALIFSLAFPAYAASGDTSVYKTRTGEKYHDLGCQYLSKSCYETTLADAVAIGLTPCSKCHPPKLDTPPAVVSTPIPVPSFHIVLPSSVPTLPAEYSYSDYSSYSSHTPASTYSRRSSSRATPVPKEKVESSSFSDFLKGILLCFSPFVGIFVIVQVVKSERAKKRKALEEEQRRKAEWEAYLAEKAKREAEEARKLAEEEQRLKELYGGKPLLELAGAPSDCYIADDGFPATSGTEPWGNGYTFYITYSGSAYHKSTCRYALGSIPENAYYISRWSGKRPCSFCRPELPDLTWYKEYLRIKAIKDKYGIE